MGRMEKGKKYFLSQEFCEREAKVEGLKANFNFPCLLDENMKGIFFNYILLLLFFF